MKKYVYSKYLFLYSHCIPHITGIAEGPWEPSVMTLCSLLSAKHWRHYMLSGGIQKHPLPHYQREIKIFNILYHQVGIKSTTNIMLTVKIKLQSIKYNMNICFTKM